jgi:hypothetical protein
MKSDLAIATLIRSRMTELGLSRGEFVKRLGFVPLPREKSKWPAAMRVRVSMRGTGAETPVIGLKVL